MSRRKLLKAELGRLEFSPVQADLLAWTHVINHEVFRDKVDLNAIQMEVRRLRIGAWGICQPWTDGLIQLIMTDKYPNKSIFLNVLAHEMIHVLQLQTGQPHGHGPSFWAWKEKFKQNGLHLAESIGAKEKWR